MEVLKPHLTKNMTTILIASMTLIFFLFLFEDKASLCSSGWPLIQRDHLPLPPKHRYLRRLTELYSAHESKPRVNLGFFGHLNDQLV